jgi:exosome complex RNA-binding protein Rrp42 (RNase PH superfamily)
MPTELSRTEKKSLIWLFKEHGLRVDGRSALRSRSVSVAVDVLPSTAGSSRVFVGRTNDVLVGINLELRQYNLPAHAEDDTKRGSIAFSVEFCGVASPEFQGRSTEVLEAELVSFLDTAYAASPEFLADLFCREHRLASDPGTLRVCCWDVYVDVLVLGASGGNILDAVTYAVRAALATTVVPSVYWQDSESGGSWELDDRAEYCALLNASNAPLSASGAFIPPLVRDSRTEHDQVTLVAPRWFIIDPCAEEETLAGCFLSVASDSAQHLRAIWKRGSLPVEPDVVLDAAQQCIRDSAYACQEMDHFISELVATEESESVDDVPG